MDSEWQPSGLPLNYPVYLNISDIKNNMRQNNSIGELWQVQSLQGASSLT